jgi:aminoglycoside 6'-N-acetyltransferase I
VTIEIKVLKTGEESVLTSVTPDVFDDPINPSAARIFLADPRHHLTVAIDDGVVVGFVSAVHYFHPDKRGPQLFINEVGVDAAYQGRGIAKRLMETMLEEGRSVGCQEAWVLTDRENTAAMRLYAASGGRESLPDSVMFSFRL